MSHAEAQRVHIEMRAALDNAFTVRIRQINGSESVIRVTHMTRKGQTDLATRDAAALFLRQALA